MDEHYSTARPYTCRSCGGGMRTRGIDGECISCHQPPVQRCGHCRAVRGGIGEPWTYHPGPIPGEVQAVCSLCAATKRADAEREFWRGIREADRRKRSKRPAPEGDVFAGFREGDR